ncbi:MAG: nicotinate (nicotinamide) nucleotide adenylyltransferase [Flavobacteriales bacterium]|jgi:nicotinate-nucleotide adenylyltransferase|tara:strand:+ start:7421 stop:8008 length:588 start_codon:yes stop_codon:yes gene_type:complete
MGSKKKIGLYFGTFNPIHIGHLIIANHMANYTNLDEVWFIVSPHNPFKNKKNLLDDYARLEMVDRAIKGFDKLRVSNIEFSLSQPSYTVNTLVSLCEKYPDHNFSLIMGGDNLNTFHKWKNHEHILANHQLYVYPRLATMPGSLDNDERVNLVGAPIIQISSSFIRNAIRDKMDVRPMLPANVWEYIDEMNYYSK